MTPHHRHDFQIAADMAGFAAAAMAVRTALDTWQIADPIRYRVELIFEEVVTNVIRHGGRTSAGARDIQARLTCVEDMIVLEVEDDGKPFDPLQQPEPVAPKSLDAAPIGGLGILLVRRLASGLTYERTTSGKNRLTVTISRLLNNQASHEA